MEDSCAVSREPIPALTVFGLDAELEPDPDGGYTVAVRCDRRPTNEQAMDFLRLMRSMLDTFLGVRGEGIEQAEEARDCLVELSLTDVRDLSHTLATDPERPFQEQMELLGFAALVHVLGEQDTRTLGEWWQLYQSSGGDFLGLLEALDAANS